MSPDWSAKEEPVPYAKLDNPQTLNLYGYMQNNPLGGVDQDGHFPADLDGSNSTGLSNLVKNVAIEIGKTIVNSINYFGGDSGHPASLPPMYGPSNTTQAVTAGALAVGGLAAPVVDAAFGGSVTVTATAPAEIETQSTTVSGYIGDNIVQGSGRVNSDLPGGPQAAQNTFNQQTAGQATSIDPKTGQSVAADGTRLRTAADGTGRVERPASVTGDQHETVHFKTPDKTPDKPQ